MVHFSHRLITKATRAKCQDCSAWTTGGSRLMADWVAGGGEVAGVAGVGLLGLMGSLGLRGTAVADQALKAAAPSGIPHTGQQKAGSLFACCRCQAA